MREKIKHLLNGAVDIHLHATPDVHERCQSILEVAREAEIAGMKAIVYKTHDFVTAGITDLLANIVPGIQVFGGCALNHATGGFNARTVEVTAQLGGKTVWMLTLDSAWFHRGIGTDSDKSSAIYSRLAKGVSQRPGLSIFDGGLDDKTGQIKSDVIDVLEVISEYGLILETGHLSPTETLALVGEARARGIEKVLCTHVNNPSFGLSVEEQGEAAGKGAYLMFSFTPCMSTRGAQHPRQIAEMVRAVGPQQCVIATDFGAIDNPKPVEGMRLFLANLLYAGLTEVDLEIMVKENPCSLLGI